MKRIFYSSFVLFAALSFYGSSEAQQLTLVKDINYGNPGRCEGTQGQPIQNLMNVNGILYFTGSPGFWKTNGTAAGTSLVKGGLLIQSIIPVNGNFFFVNYNSGSGTQELWTSDGTEFGTRMVKDFSYSLVYNLIDVNGKLFFEVFTSGIGYQLWKSDGTEVGTESVQTFESMDKLTVVNGTIFFSVSVGPPYRWTVWKSDGTTVGTVMVKDNLRYNGGVAINDILYFSADDGINGYEIWKTDGTTSGTVLVKDVEAGSNGSNPRNFVVVNDQLYFFAGNPGSSNALWKTDGTTAGTVHVKNIDDSEKMIKVNGTLFFSGVSNSFGAELWKSDGTTAGTIMVKDIFPGSSWSYPDNLVDVNGTLFFTAMYENIPPGMPLTCTSPGELWKSDGTEAGTVMVRDIFRGAGTSNPSKLTNVNGTLFFAATNGLNGIELWKSSGTSASTSMVKDLFSSGNSNPASFTLMNGLVFFSAFDAHAGPGVQIKATEMYRTDGTVSGTFLVADIFGLGSSHPKNFTNVNGTLFFSANNGSHGYELFKSNGQYTPIIDIASTGMVKDINPLFGSAPDRGSNPSNLTAINNTLYFSAMDGTNGYELWKSDGTETGTVMVKEINAGANDSSPSYLVNANGVLYFAADNGTDGRELWKSDGTSAGTVMVKNINASAGSNPAFLTVSNGILYFIADDGSNGTELWKSDGTSAGTVMVKNINPGNNNSNPGLLKDIHGILYFIADNGSDGIELWKSDGTEAGTILVKDIHTGPNSSNPASITDLNGIAYYSADNGIAGRELWRSDGTEAGTFLVKDINIGGGSSPTLLTKVANTIVFAADDGISGTEVWVSNGSANGTRIMTDIEPGVNGSNPTEIIEYGPKLLVAATSSMVGSEVWVADAPADSPLPLELLEFKGAVVNTDGLLQWKTDNEVNTSLFVLERSTDGSNYKSIGSVVAANSPGIHYYDFTDRDIVSFGVENIYYRLKQTDIDGKYMYSSVVVLSIDNQKNIVLRYINPVKDKINLTINLSQREKIQWQLLDNTGRLMKTGYCDLAAGSTAVNIDIAHFSSGIYLMRLNGSSFQETIKLVKQ